MAETYKWTVDYLKLVGSNGIILNKKKFTFGRKVVVYAGFCITADKVLPLEKNFTAVKEFPTPTNILDIRSFFTLVYNLNFIIKVRDLLRHSDRC